MAGVRRDAVLDADGATTQDVAIASSPDAAEVEALPGMLEVYASARGIAREAYRAFMLRRGLSFLEVVYRGTYSLSIIHGSGRGAPGFLQCRLWVSSGFAQAFRA